MEDLSSDAQQLPPRVAPKQAACILCHSKKLKCNRGPGQVRCERCLRFRAECIIPDHPLGRQKGVKKFVTVPCDFVDIDKQQANITPVPIVSGRGWTKPFTKLSKQSKNPEQAEMRTTKMSRKSYRTCKTCLTKPKDSLSAAGQMSHHTAQETALFLSSASNRKKPSQRWKIPMTP